MLAACIMLLSAFAWLALWRADDSALSFAHQHHHAHYDMAPLSAMLLFVSGWTVMTVAMMLPTSMPILAVFHTLAAGRRDRPVLVGLVVAGYLTAWGLFGGLSYAAVLILHKAVLSELGQNMGGGAPLLLLLAGAFQFSSLKYRCLDRCRSPMSFVIGHWRGRRHAWEAFRLGWDHGLFCVGCCWALMLLMFAVGSGSIAWMFLLAVVMAVEKNVSWGRRISAPVGIGLLTWGTLLLAGAK